jgi:hypothetical protein
MRNTAIGALRATGITNIAAANRHHARDSPAPWHYSASSDDFAGALHSRTRRNDLCRSRHDYACHPR